MKKRFSVQRFRGSKVEEKTYMERLQEHQHWRLLNCDTIYAVQLVK
jgi:hypothetical protein